MVPDAAAVPTLRQPSSARPGLPPAAGLGPRPHRVQHHRAATIEPPPVDEGPHHAAHIIGPVRARHPRGQPRRAAHGAGAADHFDRVTIVDRDELDTPVGTSPAVAYLRAGTPTACSRPACGSSRPSSPAPPTTCRGRRTHGRHAGQRALLRGRAPAQAARRRAAALAASRPLLESYVRARVAALPGVELLGGLRRRRHRGVARIADRIVGATVQRRDTDRSPSGATPTSWWMRRAAACGPRAGWPSWATSARPRSR